MSDSFNGSCKGPLKESDTENPSKRNSNSNKTIKSDMTPVAYALLFSEFRKLAFNTRDTGAHYGGLTGKITQFMRSYNPISKTHSTTSASDVGIDMNHGV